MSRVVPIVIAALALATAASAEPKSFGVGDVVYKKELKEPLPNVFGKPDLFGRKRIVGFIELRYLGLHDGAARFVRRDTQIFTNENTVNRAGTGVVFGSNGQSATVYGLGRGPNAQPLPPNEFELSALPGAALVVDGTTLTVVEATSATVTVDVPKSSR
jgi:hypothetical protein